MRILRKFVESMLSESDIKTPISISELATSFELLYNKIRKILPDDLVDQLMARQIHRGSTNKENTRRKWTPKVDAWHQAAEKRLKTTLQMLEDEVPVKGVRLYAADEASFRDSSGGAIPGEYFPDYLPRGTDNRLPAPVDAQILDLDQVSDKSDEYNNKIIVRFAIHDFLESLESREAWTRFTQDIAATIVHELTHREQFKRARAQPKKAWGNWKSGVTNPIEVEPYAQGVVGDLLQSGELDGFQVTDAALRRASSTFRNFSAEALELPSRKRKQIMDRFMRAIKSAIEREQD